MDSNRPLLCAMVKEGNGLIFRKMETLNIHRPGCRTYIFIYTLSIQTLKICRVQSETSGIGDFGEIPRVYSGNLGFYHYLEIFGVLLNLRSLCKYNQWFCNYLSDSAKKVRV